MMNRKDFLKTSAIAASASFFPTNFISGLNAVSARPSNRPPFGKRNFVSEAVEELIQTTTSTIGNEELAWMFEGCFPNTLDTTVQHGMLDGKPDTFVITGDIPAMWLRDSTAQVWPYLPLMKNDDPLKQLIVGVIHRQTRCILIDPYANAFNKTADFAHQPWKDDVTEMKPELHERKWEIDSLCYPVRLAYGYWKETGDASPFTQDWVKAMHLVIQTFIEQQRKSGRGPYKFQRITSRWNDTLPLNGYGNPTRPNGMIHSMFRPSDDSCIYPYLIPSNLFAVVSLKQLAEIASTENIGGNLSQNALELAQEVEAAIQEFGLAEHPVHGKIYAYEADGFGNVLFMDDANIPSLLSLPYLGCCKIDDPLYQKTRNFVLSLDNPHFYRGSAAEGTGGAHIDIDMVWPLSIIMRSLTSNDEHEIAKAIQTLKNTHASTGFMHESFHKNDPSNFTRSWFAWANTLFGEMILRTLNGFPHLISEK